MAGCDTGFTVIPNCLLDSSALTTTQKMVLIILLRYVNKKLGTAWPSLKQIAKAAGISRSWAITILQELDDKGYICKHKKCGGVTHYEVLTGQLSRLVDTVDRSTELTRPVDSVDEEQFTESTSPVHSVAPTITSTTTTDTSTNTNLQDDTYYAEFEVFFAIYPKSLAPEKTLGMQQYVKLRKQGVSADDLRLAAKHYAHVTSGRDPRYIKQCKTFLQSGVWRDYILIDTREATPKLRSPAELFPQTMQSLHKEAENGRQ